MKRFFAIATAALVLAACSEKQGPASEPGLVKVEPVITRALSLNFKEGNAIGLDIIRADGSVFAENALLTYSAAEKAFTGEQKWYAEGGESCSLRAYYPYCEAGFPETFSVESDQRGGTDASDLMTATKSGVYPASTPELMVFRHHLSQIVVNLDNKAGASVAGVTIKNLVPTAVLTLEDDGSMSVAADPEAQAADIQAESLYANQKYCAVVVPQTFDNMAVVLQMEGASAIITGVDGAELKPGYSYTVNISISSDYVDATIGGEIQEWGDGGNLAGGEYEVSFEEHDGYFIYDGATYTTALMKDGKVWMTQNMRYLPMGVVPCGELVKTAGGVYLPLVVNEDQTGLEFSNDPDVLVSNGYLYQVEAALGVPVGSVLTIEQMQALEGAQGLCPKGWHVPTADDMVALVGKIASYPYAEGQSAENAPYYDQTTQNASIALLNEDGFNAGAWGAVTIKDFETEIVSTMGFLSSTPDRIVSSYLCGSSYGSVSYNVSGDETSGIKNMQVWAIMPFLNGGTYNGAKLHLRSAVPLRCVKDVE